MTELDGRVALGDRKLARHRGRHRQTLRRARGHRHSPRSRRRCGADRRRGHRAHPGVMPSLRSPTSPASSRSRRCETSIEQGLGPIDILVANAGGSTVRPGPLEDISEADWRASVDANLTTTFLTIKAFLPGMRQRHHGAIITMSSAAARRPTPQSPLAYAAAKAGIEVLTKELAAQAGPDGIRVNCLAPETILTERNQQQIPEADPRTAAPQPSGPAPWHAR